MSTLLTADGNLLRATRPAGNLRPASGSAFGGGFGGMFGGNSRFPFDGQGPDLDGYLLSYESIYRSQPVVAGVVDKLSHRIATLPVDAYRRNGDARELVRGDSLDTLLRRPMPRQGTVHLLGHIGQSLFVHGNALVAKVRGNDPDEPPTMLWPLDWAQMSAYAPQGGRIEYWSTFQFDGLERWLRPEDVVHFAWPAPDGGEIGVSALEKLGTTVRLEDAAQAQQIAMFKNGSRPSLAVSLEAANPNVDQLDYARARVEAMHKGSRNAGKTFFMGSNVKLQPLSLSPVEAALIEQRKLSREEIGAVYDLSGPLMNDLTHGTFSNVTELLRSMYRDVLPVWTTLIEQTFQAQLLDTEPAWLDRFLAFDFTDKLKGDPVELATSLKMQVEAGLITRNEARRILNMPPIGDPDDPANPANQLTLNTNNQGSLDAMDNAPGPVTPQLPPAA